MHSTFARLRMPLSSLGQSKAPKTLFMCIQKIN